MGGSGSGLSRVVRLRGNPGWRMDFLPIRSLTVLPGPSAPFDNVSLPSNTHAGNGPAGGVRGADRRCLDGAANGSGARGTRP
jgi:hypothetical protein